MTHLHLGVAARPAFVPNPHVPCPECARVADARHAAERAHDWARAELLRREGLRHGDEVHRGR
ncbi:hypothetical protein ACH4PU_35640 [Streptomyces sp. NPDC021100]|uniref:hypothetical protein n=1 Tax=Streptomyces sp. NPDC021100 TaxID=3365114 RepID=UPI00379A75B7